MQNRRLFGLLFKFRTTSGQKRNVPTLNPTAVYTTPEMRSRGIGGHAIFSSCSSSLTLPRLVTPTTSTDKSYCSLTGSDVKNRVETITELFFDARELLEDAVSFRYCINATTMCI